MKIKEIRISNYRSIRDEQSITPGKITTLIGPNNAGKTNALRAIAILFGGFENGQHYDNEVDLPSDRQNKKTSIIATFEVPPEQAWILEELDKLHALQGTTRENDEVTLYLYFSPSNTPVYNFFTNIRRPQTQGDKQEYSRIARGLVSRMLDKFSVNYIPSEKSIGDLYETLLLPHIVTEASEILESVKGKLTESLGQLSSNITKHLTNAGIARSDVEIGVPDGDLKQIIGGFELMVTDTVRTSYMQKGRGVQAAIFYAGLNWVNDRLVASGKIPIWLVEEPESYLHPELAKNCQKILYKLADKSEVFISTHSMQFLPSNPREINGFQLIESSTVIGAYEKHDEACAALKKSLGLRFSDYYGLSDANVFVEGKWDVLVLTGAIGDIERIAKRSYPTLRTATKIEKDGIANLEGFLKAVFEHIRKEVAAVTIFDGDDAGVKARRSLQTYFGRIQVGFNANDEFISVRSGYPVEGIWPDKWMSECQMEHSGWFESWSVDAQEIVEPFNVKDSSKESYTKYMISRLAEATYDNAPLDRVIAIFDALESSLTRQKERLGICA